MIAQGFGFTRDFLKERNNSAYCRLKKIPCGFKEQARARHPGEKCGLERNAYRDGDAGQQAMAYRGRHKLIELSRRRGADIGKRLHIGIIEIEPERRILR